MKLRKLCILLALLAAFQYSKAQRLDILGGVNSSGFKHTLNGQRQDASGNFNIHFGMGVFVPFNPKEYKDDGDTYGVLPTLTLMKRGASKSTILGPSVADFKLTTIQLNLPVTYLAGAYGIGVGPYAAYVLSGKKKYRVGNGNKEKIDFSNELKKIDCGVSINFQLNIFKIQYDLGLTNMGRGNNGTVKSRNFSLSLNIPIVSND
ncbi:MAG: outer membrane beta-barrel protein [Chitinophagaceae bacterium]